MNRTYAGLKVWFVVPLALIGLTAGCKSFEDRITDQGFRRLSSSEIQSAFSGNTFIGRTVGSKYTYIVYFRVDGTMRGMGVIRTGELQKGMEFQIDVGHWKMTEHDMFCDQWQNWQAASDCDRIYMRGEESVFVNTDGTKSASGIIEQGNSMNF